MELALPPDIINEEEEYEVEEIRKCYKLKNLVFVQEKEPCIRLTQENSIESSVQDSLPYIPWTHGPC